jgi:Sulfotransferase family
MHETRTRSIPPLFVVGTGRCGSTLLADMLHRHPDLLTISEFLVSLSPHAFPAEPLGARCLWRILSEPRPKPTLMYRHGLTVPEFLYRPTTGSRFGVVRGVPPICLAALPYLGDADELFDEVHAVALALPPAAAGEQYARLFDWLARRFDRPRWVERSGSSLRFLPAMVKAFPGARFVHIFRDGRDCAVSMSRHHAFRLGAIAETLRQCIGVDPFRSSRRLRAAQLPERLAPLLPERFEVAAYRAYEIPLEQFGTMWSAQIVTGVRVMQRLGAAQIQVSYEDLLADPEHELTRIAGFADLDPDPAWLTHAAQLLRRPRSSWQLLPAHEHQALARSCVLGMRLLERG